MEDLRFGAVVRAARMTRRWRQRDVAARAGVSQATVWRVERGRIDEMTVSTVRRVCKALEIRIELQPRGRGADLDLMVNARHSALHESVARALARAFPRWEMAHEVSFSIWGERGVIDLLLWHPGRRALLIIEFKTELVDTGELLGTMDRRRRLAPEIVAERGWEPLTVSTWVIVARSRTNERRLSSFRTVLRSAFPLEGRRMLRWLREPAGVVAGLSLWALTEGESVAPVQRVRRPTAKGSQPAT
jgi:transcriptional regulator with XRE-family HTH domain